MSIHVKDFCFVAFPVSDIARARDFYERVLGLKVGRISEGAGEKFWIEYDIGGVCLAISNALPLKTGGTPVMIEVADLDAAHAALRSAGVCITEELGDYPLCRSFGVTDPDGNELGFHQLKPAHLVPVLDPDTACKVSTYAHQPTGGRMVGYHQPADDRHVHLFSPTGIFIATEASKAAEPQPTLQP